MLRRKIKHGRKYGMSGEGGGGTLHFKIQQAGKAGLLSQGNKGIPESWIPRGPPLSTYLSQCLVTDVHNLLSSLSILTLRPYK